MSLVSPNKKAGGGTAKPVEAVKRTSTAPYKGTLNDLFNIPAGFENYPAPKDGKMDEKYLSDLSKSLKNYYLTPDYDKFKADYGSNWWNVYESQNKLFTEYLSVVDKYEGKYNLYGDKHTNVKRVKSKYGHYIYEYTGPKVQSPSEIEQVIVEQFLSGGRNASYKGFGANETYKFRDYIDESNRGKNIRSSAAKLAKIIYNNQNNSRKGYYTNAQLEDAKDVAAYVATAISQKNQYEELAKKTWGPDYANKLEYQEWLGRTKNKLGNTVETSLTSMTKNGNIKDIKLPSTIPPIPGRDVTGSFWDQVGDFFEGVADYTVNLATGVLETPVTLVEAVDDIVEGKNVGETLLDTTLKVTGTQDLVDATNDLIEGDIVGAVGNTYEYGYGQQENIDQGSFVSGATPPTDIAATKDYLDALDEVTDPSKDNILSDLREDINEVAMGEDIPIDPAKELKMPNIEKTTMNELKALLGLAEDREDEAVIEALIGTEARKMADDPDIARMRALQGTVAERGYDVGEREALSAKARRELAGMARQQGMAAGAAAGGLRGASVAAQSRALSEQAMQKQADVTTEMDKASIARKDAARQQLATLAKDVTKFDIEKEQERKKRKGATTIGIQSLLNQEELAKQQMDLANQ